MTQPTKLLVATDFSEAAVPAEDAAVAWAQRFGAELHWIHALEVPIPIFEPYAVAVPEQTIAAARKAATSRLEAAQAKATAAGLEGTAFIGEVPAAYSIVDRAEVVGADLIVIGTHGYQGIRRAFLGSVAEKTVKLASCSIVTVKAPLHKAPQKLLVAVDFSEESRRALEVAAGLAREFGARLHLLHGLEFQMPWVDSYEVSIPPGVVDAARKEAREKLEQWAADFADVETTVVLRNAPAHLAILEAATEGDVDLIFTGSRGLKGLKHALLGSVAERTLRSAPCSVWTVRL